MNPINLDLLVTPPLAVTVNEYHNEIRTLQTLHRGLFHLYMMLKSRELNYERQLAARLKPGERLVTTSFGLDYDDSTDKLDLIASFFHWFGVSVVNYSRLVGFIRGLDSNRFKRADLRDSANFKKIKEHVDGYVNGVDELANVLVWRNKIGAHFAITAPRSDDNIATLDMSVLFPVTFESGRYMVGAMVLTRGNPAGTHKSEIPPWSLTDVFEKLISRYWPGTKVPTIDLIPPQSDVAPPANEDTGPPAGPAGGA